MRQPAAMTVEIRRALDPSPPGRARPPRTSWHVEREHVIRQVSRAVDRVPLTLIRAPAGTGKTIAAVDWVSRRVQEGRPVAWLSLTDSDDDPGVFWPHLRGALMVGGLLPEVTVPRPRRPDSTAVDALSARLAQHGGPVVIVIDAVDRLRSSAVGDQLRQLLENGGEWLRLVMTSRTEPALPIQRYRVEDAVVEIGAGDLALGRDEIDQVLAGHDVSAPEELSGEVLRRTEGWAAAVRLAALRLAAPGPRADLDGFAAPYVREQVLDALGSSAREVLTAAAVVDELPPGLAPALTGRPDADALIRTLSTGNTFLVAVPERPEAFRLHPLVAEVLRAELDQRSPGRSTTLHRRAADWFDDHGELEAAVRHVTAAGDWQGAAARVVEGRGLAEVILGTTTGLALAAELAAIPEQGTPQVTALRAAIALREGDLDSARVALERTDGQRGVAASVIRTAWYDAAGRPADTLAAASEARSALAGVDAADPLVAAVVATAEGAALLRAGDLDAASAALGEAVSATAGADGPLRLRCLAELALAEAAAGRLTKALTLADLAEQTVADDRVPVGSRPVVLDLARVWVAVERQELIEAQRSLHRMSRARSGRDETWRTTMLLLRARYLRDRGDLAGARRQLGQARPVGGSAPEWLRAEWAVESRGLGAGEQGATRWPAPGVDGRVGALLDEADRRCRAGDVAAARRDVGKALQVGRVERLRRPFVHAPATVRSLIRNDAQVSALAEWLRPDQPGGDYRGPVPQPVVETLSGRELEVLRHLAEFLTTEEIAAAMFISVNTVRTHVRRVLEKLGVSRRHEAVRRGQELGLV